MSNIYKGGKFKGKDIKLQPGDPVNKEVFIDVSDQPIHVFGLVPEGHTVTVFRIYNGDNECINDVPELPVMCSDGTSPLSLFNVQDPEVPGGRAIQDDLWLFYQGRYKLQYNHIDPQATEIPADFFLWCMADNLVPQIGINLPLCGENTCEPDNFCIGGPDRDIVDGDILQICENGLPIKVRYVNPDTFTNVVDNGDNTYTATLPNGTTVTWVGDTFGSATDNGDGTITITNNDGSTVTFDRNSFTQVIDNGDGTFTSIQPNNVTHTWVGTDQFVTITDNGDGTFTGVNVNGNPVTWVGTDQFVTITDNGDGTFTGVNVNGNPVTWFGNPSFVTGGTGVTVTGSGTQVDPFVVSTDLCSLREATSTEITNAGNVWVAGCIDGEDVRLPFRRDFPGPLGQVIFTDISDCASTDITFTGASSPECNQPGITQASWWVSGANGVVFEGINTIANPTFPFTVSVDVCSALFPITAHLLLTDACGQGGDLSGTGLPATAQLDKDLPIANISIPSTIPDLNNLVLDASLSTPSDGTPGGLACPNITSYEYVISAPIGGVFATITTGATGTAVNSGTHPSIVGGVAEAPIINLDSLPGISGQVITVSLLVTDCNGQAGQDLNADGSGDENVPATSSGFAMICESVSVRDITLDIPSETFTENDFSVFTEVVPFKQFDASAIGNGSLSGSINVSMQTTTTNGFLVTGGTRVKIDSTIPGPEQINYVFDRVIESVVLEAFDVDVPNENILNYNGNLVSVLPPFGDTVLSNVTVNGINSNTFSFDFDGAPAFAVTLDIVQVTTAVIESPCFAATKCTLQNGSIIYTRDSDNSVLNNADIVEC